MSLTIEQGKMHVETLLHKLANKNGIELTSVRWRETIDPPFYYLEAVSSTGRVANRKFSPEHLAGSESNTSAKVVMKIHSILIKLKEPESGRL
jgi:hypothetical protein